VEEIVKPGGGDLYLSVCKENTVACQFYERNGMVVVGTMSWAAGTIPGLVYSLSPKQRVKWGRRTAARWAAGGGLRIVRLHVFDHSMLNLKIEQNAG
jgi:hypothetical protein